MLPALALTIPNEIAASIVAAAGTSAGMLGFKLKTKVKNPWLLRLIHIGGTVGLYYATKALGLPSSEITLGWGTGLGISLLTSYGAQKGYDDVRSYLSERDAHNGAQENNR